MAKKLTFGKYKGKTLEDIAETDPNYLVWLVDNVTNKPDLITVIVAMEGFAEYYQYYHLQRAEWAFVGKRPITPQALDVLCDKLCAV